MEEQGERKEHRVLSGEREGFHVQHACGAATLPSRIIELMSYVLSEESLHEAAVPLPGPEARPYADSVGESTMVVTPVLEPSQIWRSVEDKIRVDEKQECLQTLNDKEPSLKVIRMVTKMEYSETHFRLVYAPFYLVCYTHGDPQSDHQQFFLAINGLDGELGLPCFQSDVNLQLTIVQLLLFYRKKARTTSLWGGPRPRPRSKFLGGTSHSSTYNCTTKRLMDLHLPL